MRKKQSLKTLDKNLRADVVRQLEVANAALNDKKAEDIVPLSLYGKTSMADAMLIATGTSSRHVATLVDSVCEALAKAGYTVSGVEGQMVGDWVIVDTGDVLVHVFQEEARAHYRLERLWSHNFDLDVTHDDEDLLEQVGS